MAKAKVEETKTEAPSLVEAVDFVALATDPTTRVLDQLRLAFMIHEARLGATKAPSAIQYLPQTSPVNPLRYQVGQGTPLSDYQTGQVFVALKEFVATGELVWAASAVDVLLASDKLVRQG